MRRGHEAWGKKIIAMICTAKGGSGETKRDRISYPHGTMQNVHSLNPPEIKGEVKDKILEVLRVFHGRVFTAEELQVAILPRYSIETIRDAMWELNDEGKAKLWVRLP